MSFSFRTVLAAALLVAAQSLPALASSSDSLVRLNVDRAEPASGSRAAALAEQFTKARSPDGLNRSSAGYYEADARTAARSDFGTTSSTAAKGGITYGASASKQASAPKGTCPGEVINYTLQLQNTSDPEAGSGTGTIIDELDFDVNIVGNPSANTGTASYNAGTHTVTWSGSLAVGQTVTLTFSVTIKDVPNGTVILNDPSFELDFGDPVLGPFFLKQPVELEVQCGGGGTIAALGTKSAFSPFGGCPGDPIFYRITLTNLSDPIIGTLPGFIDDFLDDDVNLDDLDADRGVVDYDPFDHRIVWNGNLDVGETVTIDVVVIVKDVPDWTPIENDPFFELGPLQFLLPIPIVIPTICTDFIIDEGVTGSYFDSLYNGQGINVEILAKEEDGLSGVALVYWYSYGPDGFPFFAFGVGTYFGNIMLVDMLFDIDGGPIFGPDWDIEDFDPFFFTDILILWKDCDKLGFFFDDLPTLLAIDYPWYLMNMDRITQVAGIPCPFQDLDPPLAKQAASSPAPVARPPLKPLLEALPDSSLARAGGRERVYERLGLKTDAPPPSLAKPAAPPVGDREKGFQIGIGMTGSFYDPAFNGQGINLEILSLPAADKGGGSVLMYWYSFDVFGFPIFMFGVGTFSGDTMIFDMLIDYDGTGPFFGPLWNPAHFVPTPFGTATIVWAGCNAGVMNFTLNSAFAGLGFVPHVMNLERITSISKIPCT